MTRITKLGAACFAVATLANAPSVFADSKPTTLWHNESIGAPTTAQNLLPVLVLSEDLGDSGMELGAAGATLTKPEKFSFNAPKALVYLDVDSFDRTSKSNIDTILLARELRWPIVIESLSWNAREVENLANELFPDIELKSLGDTTAIVEYSRGKWSVSNTYPSEVALKVGVPRHLTSEGKSQAAQPSAKARAAGSLLPHFANLAYTRNLPPSYTSPWLGNGSFRVEHDRDIVKVFRRYQQAFNGEFPPSLRVCVVAWRGTDSGGDWLRNIQNQFGPEVRPWSVPAESAVRIGRGYQRRLENYRDVLAWVTINCDAVHVTGHSLGGGTAQAHAFTLRETRNRFGQAMLGSVEAYNSARVGNPAFVQVFRSAFGGTIGGRIRVYCRTHDHVSGLPVGLLNSGATASGCDVVAPHVTPFHSLFDPRWIANHNMALWL